MNLPIFLAGFVGALAPEIVRLYQLRQEPQTFQPWYYVISLLYAALGGYVATILPGVADGPLWWAFAVGAGLNAVVSMAARQATAFLPTAGQAAPPKVPRAEPPTRGAAEAGVEPPPAEVRPGGMADFWRAL